MYIYLSFNECSMYSLEIADVYPVSKLSPKYKCRYKSYRAKCCTRDVFIALSWLFSLCIMLHVCTCTLMSISRCLIVSHTPFVYTDCFPSMPSFPSFHFRQQWGVDMKVLLRSEVCSSHLVSVKGMSVCECSYVFFFACRPACVSTWWMKSMRLWWLSPTWSFTFSESTQKILGGFCCCFFQENSVCFWKCLNSRAHLTWLTTSFNQQGEMILSNTLFLR